jgi:succinate dehydrogenase / fumarate reductase, flavoprotein subunit
VFGRAAAIRCAETIEAGLAHQPLPEGFRDYALSRLDRLRHADGGTPTAEIRLRCSGHAEQRRRVPYGETVLGEGCEKIAEVWSKRFADVRVTDRSLIWNSDLVETLELRNLMGLRVT